METNDADDDDDDDDDDDVYDDSVLLSKQWLWYAMMVMTAMPAGFDA